MCTDVEHDTNTLPAGTVMTYTPVGADTTGVTATGNTGVTVTIRTNLFGIAVQGNRVVTPPTPTPAAPSVTASLMFRG